MLRLSYLFLVMLIVPLVACADSQQAEGGAGVKVDSQQVNAPVKGASFEEDVHYVELFQPLTVDTPADKIEVAEFFWYGCPHCYHLEPGLQKWKKTAAEDIQVVSIPAVMNPSWKLHAKAFYAAEAMGILDKVHGPLFQAIHDQGRRLFSEDTLLRFFGSRGIDEAKFKAAMDSMAVATKVKRADKLGKDAALTGVPALIVAGRYRVLSGGVKSYEEMFQVVDFLVEKERSHRQNSSE
ncbi:MAG: thiol:disulfide interchange protein DsbA/DsbL [Thiothrix sp.]|nr:MAG: thiol:disulfide interchange protein DsbA/DsbL [Thiothrix sp.]